MHSNLAPLLIALGCTGAQALGVNAACMQPAGEGMAVFVEVRCADERDCATPPEQVSIEFIGMDVGAFPVSRIAWIDAQGRASLEAPKESQKTWPRRAVWDLAQSFVVDARRARFSVDNQPITPDFDLRRDCARLPAAALALLKEKR